MAQCQLNHLVELDSWLFSLTIVVFVYTIKSKTDIDCMKDIITKANAVGHKIRRVRSDNAKEFIGKDMKKILRDHSIFHEVLTAYCPEQNGRAE